MQESTARKYHGGPFFIRPLHASKIGAQGGVVAQHSSSSLHGPVQPFAKTAAHDPSLVVFTEPVELFGKQRDHLPVRVTHPRNIRAPEHSLGSEGVEDLAQVTVQDRVRIGLA